MIQKRIALVIGAILLVWIAVPAFEVTMAVVSTDIMKTTCIPWGIYSSYQSEKAIVSLIFLVAYLLPLLVMVFMYSKIVYTLKTKVTLTVSLNAC